MCATRGVWCVRETASARRGEVAKLTARAAKAEGVLVAKEKQINDLQVCVGVNAS